MKCSAPRSVFACLLVTLSFSLVGCSASLKMPDTVTPNDPMGQGTGDIQGYVHGGRQPIAGANIYLYGASNIGYSSNNSAPPAPISLLGNQVSPLSPDGKCDSSVVAPLYFDGTNCYYLTGGTSGNTVDPIGGFNLSGLYHCNVSSSNAPVGSLPGQQVWIFSIGGYPGAPTGVNAGYNVQAGLTAALGTCNAATNNFSTYTYVYVNEVSTVAFAYALAGFAADAQHVSAPPTNYSYNADSNFAPGLTNAFNNAAQLYDIFGGTDPGDHSARHKTPNANGTNLPAEGNGTPPYILINSLANVLATCINTADPASSGNQQSSQCQVLTQDVITPGPNTEVDTASLAIYIAQNPSPPGLVSSVASLLNTESASSPWVPNYATTNTAYPFDLTAAITFSGVSSPTGVAIDGNGDAYISSIAATVTELSPKGNVIASASTPSAVSYITIDSSGYIWMPSTNLPAVYAYNSGLTYIGSDAVTSSSQGISLSKGTHQITADDSGVIYIADAGTNSVWVVNGTNVSVYNSTENSNLASCTTGVTGVAFDPTHGAIWTAGPGGTGGADEVCELIKGSPKFGETLGYAPTYVAIDSAGYSWLTAAGNNSLYQVTSNPQINGPFGGGGLESPSFLTVDGADDIWVVNNAGNPATSSAPGTAGTSLSEFYNGAPYSPGPAKGGTVSGFQYNELSYPSGIAIDQSGDVWVTSQKGSINGNLVFEVIGAAYPTTAPLYKGTGEAP